MKSANVGRTARTDNPDVTLQQVVETLRGSRRVLCFAHPDPDGDALGSTLALALALTEMGREVTLYCPTPIPGSLRFLPGLASLVPSLDGRGPWDATVICDVGSSRRIGPSLPERARLGVLINLDHHLTSDDFGDVNCVDAEAASVGVMVARVLAGLGHPLSRDVATALYTSVLTDTGSFRYSSTNPEALRTAADCVAAGVDPWEVSSAIYEQQPLARLKLLARALDSLELSPDGSLATLVVSREMSRIAGGDRSLTDGFVNYARSVAGVQVAALLVEPMDAGEPWSLSLRSRGGVNVAAVAALFGGGGHHNAAGLKLHGTAAEVRSQLAAAVARVAGG